MKEENKLDNIDIMIENTIKNKICEPYGYEQAILTAFNNKKKFELRTFFIAIIKTIVTLFAGLVITLSAVFSKDIYNWIYSIFNPETTGEGIIKSAEGGYLYNTEMEYINKDGINFKIENILMDDFNLYITFNIESEEILDKIDAVEINKMIITDENKNIIFCDNKEIYEKYCGENNIEYSEKNMNNSYTNSGHGIEILSKTENNIRFIYKMYSTEYPKSEELNFDFEGFHFYNRNNNYNIDKNDKWNIKVDLLKEFYKRDTVFYNATYKNNNSKVIVENATASESEMIVNLKIKTEYKIKEKDRKDKIEEIISSIGPEDTLIDNIIIENEFGHKFGVSQVKEQESIWDTATGEITKKCIFEITNKELTDKLTLKLFMNNKEITIVLNKRS